MAVKGLSCIAVELPKALSKFHIMRRRRKMMMMMMMMMMGAGKGCNGYNIVTELGDQCLSWRPWKTASIIIPTQSLNK